MKFKPPVNPWEAPDLEPAEILAFKALSAGNASPNQQRIALVTILTKFAATYDMSFRPGPDGARASDFAEGKRFVGSRILNAIDRPLPAQEKTEDAGSSEDPARPDRRNPKPASRRSSRKRTPGA